MKTFLEFHRAYLFASRTLIKLATDRITNSREYQISQAKLAIATANQKLEKLEAPISVFRSSFEPELPDVGELREELTARRSDWWPPINFLKLHPLNARSGCCERASQRIR